MIQPQTSSLCQLFFRPQIFLGNCHFGYQPAAGENPRCYLSEMEMRNGWSYHAPRGTDWFNAGYYRRLSLSQRSTIAAPVSRVDLAGAFKALEQETGARLGVSAHDTGSDNRIEYRENERFAMCSTFKFLAAAAVLGACRPQAGTTRPDDPDQEERSRSLFAGNRKECRQGHVSRSAFARPPSP